MSFFWRDENAGCLRAVFDGTGAEAAARDDCLLAAGDMSSSDTCLKIVLKVKDEAFFLESWIGYHASIVGHRNLVVVDCGSTDPDHLAVLERHRDRLLVLHYRAHYDGLHSVPGNRVFYQALSRHCRYLTVIDADEFLFGVQGGTISAQSVLATLRNSDAPVHAGTWFGNIGDVAMRGDMLDVAAPHRFEACSAAIRDGTFSGKAVVRADATIQARHIGHNLHVGEVVSLLDQRSFGGIGIFHFNALPAGLQKARALKHLRGRNVVPPEVETSLEVERLVRQLLEAGGQQRSIMKYLRIYAAPATASPVDPCTSCILDGNTVERDSPIAARLRAFPFGDMLCTRSAELGLAS